MVQLPHIKYGAVTSEYPMYNKQFIAPDTQCNDMSLSRLYFHSHSAYENTSVCL